MRDRGKIWPIVLVVIAAISVYVVVPLIIQTQKPSRLAAVEAYVSIGDAQADTDRDSSVARYRWPNSEVPRTAERLRDLTGVSIAAATYVVEGSLSGRVPRSADEIIVGISRRGLIPNEWRTDLPGVLQTPRATVHLRYSSRTLSVELISVPKERLDGPGILIRIPDSENTAVGSRYFETMVLDGLLYPRPFAPIAEIVASGWQPRLFKQTRISDADRVQLEQWAAAAKRDSGE
jgi:hypothetical protein